MTFPMHRTELNDLKKRPKITDMIWSSALWDIGKRRVTVRVDLPDE